MEIRSVILALLLPVAAFGQTEAIRVNLTTNRIVDMTTVKVPSGMTLEIESGGILLGSGSSLTTLNATQITTGAIPDIARLGTYTSAVFKSITSDETGAISGGLLVFNNGPTLIAPKFDDLCFIADANGNELIVLDTTASAVNEFTIVNAATGTAPIFKVTGGDTNIGMTIQSKGTGVITLNGLTVTASTGTLTIANGKTLTASNTLTLAATDSTTATFGNAAPKVHATKNGSDQTITASSFQKVTFGTETFDTNSNYASSTFTPTVAGKYRVSCSITWNSLSAGDSILLSIYKNGAELRRMSDNAAAAATLSQMITDLIDMNGSTDTIEIYVFQNNAGSKNIEGDNINTWFCAELAQ